MRDRARLGFVVVIAFVIILVVIVSGARGVTSVRCIRVKVRFIICFIVVIVGYTDALWYGQGVERVELSLF